MAKHDLFHIILRFLNKRPLDGTFYDLRECVNGKLNMADGERNGYAQFQKVIDFLQKNDYIYFDQRPAINESTGQKFKIYIKYGEDPSGDISEAEANFNTTYPMAALTLAGSNYLLDRKKETLKNKIYLATFIVAVAGAIVAFLNFMNNSNQTRLQNIVDKKDSLLEQRALELNRANQTILLQKKIIDSLIKK